MLLHLTFSSIFSTSDPRPRCCVQESWQVCVSMVVGNGPDEEDLSRRLLAAVQQPIRAHFTPLTWDGVLEKVGALWLCWRCSGVSPPRASNRRLTFCPAAV